VSALTQAERDRGWEWQEPIATFTRKTDPFPVMQVYEFREGGWVAMNGATVLLTNATNRHDAIEAAEKASGVDVVDRLRAEVERLKTEALFDAHAVLGKQHADTLAAKNATIEAADRRGRRKGVDASLTALRAWLEEVKAAPAEHADSASVEQCIRIVKEVKP
jgi:hypothetical protein